MGAGAACSEPLADGTAGVLNICGNVEVGAEAGAGAGAGAGTGAAG